MFCTLHQYCERSADNGHCTVYANTTRVRRHSKCGFVVLPEDNIKTTAKKINPLKASKRRK